MSPRDRLEAKALAVRGLAAKGGNPNSSITCRHNSIKSSFPCCLALKHTFVNFLKIGKGLIISLDYDCVTLYRVFPGRTERFHFSNLLQLMDGRNAIRQVLINRKIPGERHGIS